eukprot:Em0007g282a
MMQFIQDVMEHHSVNEDDDDIESGSTSSLNSDTDSNDFLVTEYENPGPDPDDLGARATNTTDFNWKAYITIHLQYQSIQKRKSILASRKMQ